MRCVRLFEICLLGATAMMIVGVGPASAGEASSPKGPDSTAQDGNVCAAYFKAFPQSRTRALLECQNHAEPTAAPYLTSEEAQKVYQAYMEKMTKEQKLAPLPKTKN
jgi:hypothetical protein